MMMRSWLRSLVFFGTAIARVAPFAFLLDMATHMWHHPIGGGARPNYSN